MKPKKIYTGALIILFILGCYSLINRQNNSLTEIRAYQKSIEHINFGGIITDKTYLFSDNSICEIELSHTNCNYYDIRDSSDIWSFVIKENKAEVIAINEGVEVGDSFYFSGLYFRYYRNGKMYHRGPPNVINLIYDDKDVRPKHKL